MDTLPIKILIVLFLFCSCNRRSIQTREKSDDEMVTSNDFIEMADEPEEDGDENINNLDFPKTGKKSLDFCPSKYKIQYETEGDLNRDGLTDIAIVLKHQNAAKKRPLLILLQNTDNEYYLYKRSDTAFPSEYNNEGDFFPYDTEDISINNGTLNIHLYGMGAKGNLSYTFHYSDDELILSYIEAYNAGAGSQQLLEYDAEDGTLEQTIINTMKEDMPESTRTFNLEKEKWLFESASPSDIIINAYLKTDSDW